MPTKEIVVNALCGKMSGSQLQPAISPRPSFPILVGEGSKGRGGKRFYDTADSP